MEEKPSDWTNVFFSGNPPESIKGTEISSEKDFPPFPPENVKLRGRMDNREYVYYEHIQVYWLLSDGHRKYVGKIFPDYTRTEFLTIFHHTTPAQVGFTGRVITDDDIHEFDRFFREARAYTHIDRFCPAHERPYFLKFYGVDTNIQRYSSSFVNQRAIVLEPLKMDIRSRRVLGENTSQLPETFSDILSSLPLSPFEYQWYCSLLKDRLRRLDVLHRIGITHGDIEDRHFRLPNEFYDTVLYDFSEAYTFSENRPLRINSGKPRPLKGISEYERERVKGDVEHRAKGRDLRSRFIKMSSKDTVDDALSQSLDKEEELLELIVTKVYHRPDYFSMPTLNSILPFLEDVRPKSDPCWPIRRARLLHLYEPIWAICKRGGKPLPIIFNDDPRFKTIELCSKSRIMLCLVPKWWNMSLKAVGDSGSEDTTGFAHKLQRICGHIYLRHLPNYVRSRDEFLSL